MQQDDSGAAAVDREKTCPLLLRCFWKESPGYNAVDYRDGGNEILPKNEIQLHTWRDATLRELSDLLKDVILHAVRHKHATFTFSLVYPDRTGRFVMRKIGSVGSFKSGPDENVTLASVNFQTGDYLDVLVERSPNSVGGGRGGPGRGRDRYQQIRKL